MSPGIMIKICGITNLEDALAAVGAGARAIGFNFYPRSKRYLDPEEAARIAAKLGAAEVVKVGVFVNESPVRMAHIAARVPLDVVQLHGDEALELLESLPPGLRVWKAFRVDGGFCPEAAAAWASRVEAFLLDGPAGGEYGGAGIPFAWNLARDFPRPVILAGGLDASNVAEAMAQARPWGVDACSRLEQAPGRKDPARVNQFLKAALAAAAGESKPTC